MNHRWLMYIPALAGILVALASPATSRADMGYVAPLDELPLTAALATGARAAGMGFVSMAVADDATAMISNPAALVRLNRVELSGGFRRSYSSVDGEMAGTGFSTELSGTDFTALRFAYPFPTFRGGLVFGLSAERMYDFSGDRLAAYEAELPWSEADGIWHRKEDYLSDGGITALSAACGVDVSPAISLGLTLSYLVGENSMSFIHTVADTDGATGDLYRTNERMESDITGFRATFGGLFYVSDQLSVGVAIDTPTTLTFDGTYSGQEWIAPSRLAAVRDSTITTLFCDEITLPFAFRAGVAYVPLDLLVVGVDLSYADWSETDYAGRLTDETDPDAQQRRSLYKETLGYGVGAEVTVPSWPLRLRAGYAHRPIAYDGLTVTTDRSYFTLGAGVLIDTVLAVDIAWIKGSYEREDTQWDYDESVETSALIVEATYRF